MKKIFATLAALCTATLAYGTDYTLTNTSTPAGNAHGTYGGWVQDLDCIYRHTTTPVLTATPALPTNTTLYLTEVTIQSGGTNSQESVKLAVFSGTGITPLGTLMGVSDAVTLSDTRGTAMTFSFSSGIKWAPDTNGGFAPYQFLFVSSSASDDAVAELAGNTSWTNNVNVGVHINCDTSNTPQSGTGMITNNGLNWTGDGAGMYANYKVTDVKPVPEPATATLSLLALASLAARRRRK